MSKVAKLYDPKFRNCGKIQDSSLLCCFTNSSINVLRLHGPAGTAVDFYPKGCTFMSIFLVFFLLFLLYLFYNNQSITFLSFPKTGRTVDCVCLVSTHNQMLFIYTNIIPYRLIHVSRSDPNLCLHRG